ncbi:MFS family permease [Cytobacillus horneckiae]|uniref:MFS transporter n=1 Tax=Cytobacillus horneckiae TaxID=549687 RepID=A0A2N0ZCC0_9BACI|nr:MFS transporter [Cytobacillus horneckiae]MBN6889576.1 MFS transporter [Cytobacillus horneckiae]MCM3180958.1 MFS transporter [Cytobacillus horneckiae]MEC1158128.1 MFS transporter [Cytobacillus horneckiae]MED2936399.1 MFS transporter [Cytobacillus horneckiae]PKG27167.1 MFS transporter [Cytobacillus horneckiae]
MLKKNMKWIVLGAIFILAIVNYADKIIVGITVNPIMADLSLDYGQWGIVGSSFYWLFSIGGIIGAAYSDKIGTAKMLAIMALIWTFAQSMSLFIMGLPLLLFSRILLGAGEGPFSAVAVSHLSKWFKPEQRGLAISILNLGNNVGKSVTAPLIVILMTTFNWRIAFFFFGIVSFVWFLAWLWIGRQKPAEEIIETKTTVNEIAATVEKLSFKESLKLFLTAKFIFTTLAIFFGTSAIAFTLSFNPAYLMNIRGFSAETAANIIAIGGLTGGLCAVLISLFSDKVFKKTKDFYLSRILFTSLCLILGGSSYIGYMYFQGTTLLIISMILINAFMVAMFSLAPQIVNSLNPQRRGLMYGTAMGIGSTAGIIAPLVYGYVLESFSNNLSGGFITVVFGFAAGIIICGIMLLIFGRQKAGGDAVQV